MKLFSVRFHICTGFAIEGQVHAMTGFEAIDKAREMIVASRRELLLRNGASAAIAQDEADEMQDLLDCDADFNEVSA